MLKDFKEFNNKEFLNEFLNRKDIKLSSRKKYASALKNFFDEDASFNYDDILKRLIEIRASHKANYFNFCKAIIKKYFKEIENVYDVSFNVNRFPKATKEIPNKKPLSTAEIEIIKSQLRKHANPLLNLYTCFLIVNGCRSNEFLKAIKEITWQYDDKTDTYTGITQASKNGNLRPFVIPKEFNSTFKQIFKIVLEKHGNNFDALNEALKVALARFARNHIYTLDNWDSNKLVTSHIFRYSKASKCFRDGMKLEDIADILGHKSLSTTWVNYVKRDEEQKIINLLDSNNIQSVTTLSYHDLLEAYDVIKGKYKTLFKQYGDVLSMLTIQLANNLEVKQKIKELLKTDMNLIDVFENVKTLIDTLGDTNNIYIEEEQKTKIEK
ncbi:tyrosine-type recombinase/integrase [Mycoplasma buteonis]|uniref:tyrosine-type recombinase/integrase n=1 Tax=Mycoplasma buteonis TaxID=171280 RepID=UPI00056753C7|nr:tyrosine-type recombinase/integrase [Mycoplasma buteonis]